MPLSVPTQLKLLDRLASLPRADVRHAVTVGLVKDTQALAAQEGHTLSEDQALALLQDVGLDESGVAPSLVPTSPAPSSASAFPWSRPASLSQWGQERENAKAALRAATIAEEKEGIWLLTLPILGIAGGILGLSKLAGSVSFPTVFFGGILGLLGGMLLVTILLSIFYKNSTTKADTAARLKHRRSLCRSPLSEEEVGQWMAMPGMAETLLTLLDSDVPFLKLDRHAIEAQYAQFQEKKAHAAIQQKRATQQARLKDILTQHLAPSAP